MGKGKVKKIVSNSPVANGDTVKDKITGFQGVVTGVVDYLTGCNQALVAPPVDDKGSHVDCHWYDVDRLEVVEQGTIKVEEVTSAARPGADAPAPVK